MTSGTRLRSRSVPPSYIMEGNSRRISFTRTRTARVITRPTKKPAIGKRRRTKPAHTFRLGADYRFAENHTLGFVYNGSYDTSHYNQYTTGTQTATTLGNQESWLHNGRLDYQAPFGLKAGAEFTWYTGRAWTFIPKMRSASMPGSFILGKSIG